MKINKSTPSSVVKTTKPNPEELPPPPPNFNAKTIDSIIGKRRDNKFIEWLRYYINIDNISYVEMSYINAINGRSIVPYPIIRIAMLKGDPIIIEYTSEQEIHCLEAFTKLKDKLKGN